MLRLKLNYETFYQKHKNISKLQWGIHKVLKTKKCHDFKLPLYMVLLMPLDLATPISTLYPTHSTFIQYLLYHLIDHRF